MIRSKREGAMVQPPPPTPLNTPLAMSCHLPRIIYELFTKRVTPIVTHVNLAISS